MKVTEFKVFMKQDTATSHCFLNQLLSQIYMPDQNDTTGNEAHTLEFSKTLQSDTSSSAIPA